MKDEEQGKNKQSKALKEVPGWVGLIVAIIMVGAVGIAFASMSSNKPTSTTSGDTSKQEKEYNTVPDVCVENASLKGSSKVKSVGSTSAYLNAVHTKVNKTNGKQQMLHQWNGTHNDGTTAVFRCYTLIESDGNESLYELWLDDERLV